MSIDVDDPRPALVYDGQCPFCSRYVRLLRLRETLGALRLVDARDGGALVETLARDGVDLDEGMALLLDGHVYHGDACIHRLALLSTPLDTFNRLNRLVFRSRAASRLLYPVLRTGRNLALRLLGRRPLAG